MYVVRLEEVVIFFPLLTLSLPLSLSASLALDAQSIQKKKDRREKEMIAKGGVVVDFSVDVFERAKKKERNRKE